MEKQSSLGAHLAGVAVGYTVGKLVEKTTGGCWTLPCAIFGALLPLLASEEATRIATQMGL